MIRKQLFFPISYWILSTAYAAAIDLDDPVILYQGTEAIQFSYNTSGAIAVDSKSRVHLVYYIADDSNKPPQNQVWYLVVDRGVVSTPVRVDNNENGGGRHPSLAIDSQDTVHVVWQDYRHTTAAGKYIDNLEIYYDKKPSNGTFSDTDIRLTKTNAGNKADNGFLPNIAVGNNSRLYVTWYDFTTNGKNADVYLRRCDDQGEFPEQDGIENFRITTSIPDLKNYTSNWTPDVEAFSDGSLYAIWGFLQGWQGSYQLQGCLITADGAPGEIENIAEKSGQLTDPPRLAADRKGNQGVVAVQSVDGTTRVNLYYKIKGYNWKNSIQLNDGTFNASQPSLAFDPSGGLYTVWQEDIGGLYQSLLAHVDLQSQSVENRQVVSETDRDARTPAIAIDPQTGQIHIAWIEKGLDGERALVYRSEKRTAVENWRIHYESGTEYRWGSHSLDPPYMNNQ